MFMFSLLTESLILTFYVQQNFVTVTCPKKSIILSQVNEQILVFYLVVKELIFQLDFYKIKCYKMKNSK